MTLEQHFRARLSDIGLIALPQSLAMDYAKAHDRMGTMRDRWQTEYEEENVPLNATTWYCLKKCVGEWLDANMPDFPGRERFR